MGAWLSLVALSRFVRTIRLPRSYRGRHRARAIRLYDDGEWTLMRLSSGGW